MTGAATAAAAVRIASRCKEGTIMKGLNVFAGKGEVVAKSDAWYPEWLWGLLEKRGEKVEEGLRPEYVRLLNRRKMEKVVMERRK
ncbi:hypothetical protein BC829DRAFT_403836 [Chytridium lagenaria]|nr:hypothetical protein BC829DRAFT_403836 [Chytridium lagenaria]